MGEIWVSAPGYEGRYEVSNLGRIRSLDRTERFLRAGQPSRRRIKGKVLNPSPTAEGYLHVSLRVGGKLRLIRLHRLVALAFHGPSRPVHREVAHLDGDRANARADNLKWVSRIENSYHKRAHGTHQAEEKHPRAKLSRAGVADIKTRLAEGAGQSQLAREHGVTPSAIRDIAIGRNWRHVQPINYR